MAATFSFKAGFGFKSARRAFAGGYANAAWREVRHTMTNYATQERGRVVYRAYANQANFDAWKAFSREIGRRCNKGAAAAIEAYIAEKAEANGFSSD